MQLCKVLPSRLHTYMTSGVITVVPELPQWPTSKYCFLTAQIHSSSSSELPDFYWRNGQNCLEWGRGVRYARAQGGRWACSPHKRQLWDSRQQSSITAGGIPNSHSGWTRFAFSRRQRFSVLSLPSALIRDFPVADNHARPFLVELMSG